MFCGNCGAQNLDDATFCCKCGEALNNNSNNNNNNNNSNYNNNYYSPAHSGVGAIPSSQINGKKNKTVGIIFVSIVALIVVIIIINLFGGRSYRSTVSKYVKASFTADGKTMVSLIPDKVLKRVCEEKDMTKREAIEELTESLEYTLEYYDSNFDEWSYSYKILDTENYSNEDLNDLKDDYKDEFNLKVKAAKTVTVKIIITSDEDEISRTIEIGVVKIGNSWYINNYYYI